MQLSISTPAATFPVARRRLIEPINMGRSNIIDVQPFQVQQRFLQPSLHRKEYNYNPFVCKTNHERSAMLWVDRSEVPELIRPYMKLSRVLTSADGVGTLFLHFGPTFWSYMMASQPGMLPNFKLLGIFSLISFLVMCSCCTSNDLVDLEYDKKVERCQTRPLVAGEITPLQGWLFWGFNVALLVPLLLKLNKLCIILAAVEQLLWMAYPFMKRITYWPQAFLGVVQNWGALVGWAAVTGNLKAVNILLPLHIAGVCWTLVYDTIYAHQDKIDDAEAGVKSTALLFGDKTKDWLLGFATICIGAFSFAGYNANMGWPFYLSMIPAFGHLLWQIYTVDLSQGHECFSKFMSNKWFASIVMAGTLLGRMVY